MKKTAVFKISEQQGDVTMPVSPFAARTEDDTIALGGGRHFPFFSRLLIGKEEASYVSMGCLAHQACVHQIPGAQA